MIPPIHSVLGLWSKSWFYQQRDGDNRRNQGSAENCSGEVAKSRWRRTQSANHVFSLTLTVRPHAREHIELFCAATISAACQKSIFLDSCGGQDIHHRCPTAGGWSWKTNVGLMLCYYPALLPAPSSVCNPRIGRCRMNACAKNGAGQSQAREQDC